MPCRHCFLGEPYREVSPPHQRGIVFRPVRHSISGLRYLVAAARVEFVRHGSSNPTDRAPSTLRSCRHYGTFLARHRRTPLSCGTQSIMSLASRPIRALQRHRLRRAGHQLSVSLEFLAALYQREVRSGPRIRSERAFQPVRRCRRTEAFGRYWCRAVFRSSH